MEAIALIPALISTTVCLLWSPSAAFLNVYLPILLLVPAHLHLPLSGLPDIGFQHAAILPIALMAPFERHARWRPSITDLLVLLFCTVSIYSEYRATGLADARNIAFDIFCRVVAPYMLARIIIQGSGNGPVLAKRYVVLLLVVTAFNVWQFRMGQNLFNDFWSRYFPGQGQHIAGTPYRFGFGRAAGPFGHSILAGMMVGAALFLQGWLIYSKRWSSYFWRWGALAGLLLGSAITLSRGPWIGILGGATIALFGFVTHRRVSFIRMALVLAVLLPPATMALLKYSSSGFSGNTLQDTAAYRMELWTVYTPVVEERPYLGWGANQWPVEPHMGSVDNHYLLLALGNGVVTASLFLLILLFSMGRLLVAGIRMEPASSQSAFALALLGAIFMFGVSVYTVYLGNQSQPVFFMLIAWGEALIQSSRPQRTTAPPAFQRVLT